MDSAISKATPESGFLGFSGLAPTTSQNGTWGKQWSTISTVDSCGLLETGHFYFGLTFEFPDVDVASSLFSWLL
jgi:hypothetical protein